MAYDSLNPQEDSELGSKYPPEYVSPKVKEKRPFGVKYAKALYANSSILTSQYLTDDSEYQALIELAQGRQSTEGIRKLFGHFRDPNDPLDDDGSGNLAYLDIQALNLAPKYINRAVAKMQKYSYDIEVNAIDIVSIDEKKNFANTLQAFYRLNKWLTGLGQDPKEYFPDVDIDSLPKYPDEMLYDLYTNPKIKKEIDAELSIKLLHYVNDFKQVMREFDWWIVVLGKAHIFAYNDPNGVPRLKCLNPKYVGGSYVENESFTGQENVYFIEFLTVNMLRKEMLADGYSEEQIMEIVARYGNENSIYHGSRTLMSWERFDGLDYIPVMRFFFRSEDNRRFVKTKNQYGNDVLLEKSFDYEPGEDIKPFFESGERSVVENSYTSIYGGSWILDSEIAFGYGRKNYPRQNLVNAMLPIISFAPNMKEGRVVSFLAQMVEPIFMVNVVWNKMKEILAKGWMGVREIDFSQLEAVAMGKGGEVWTPRELYKHLLRTNTMIKRSSINRHDQKHGGGAVEDKQSGLMMADYMNTFTTAIQMLEQMTSTSIANSVSIPDRLSATAAKQSAETSDIDMEYLFNAHENVYCKASTILLMLLQESKRDGNKINGFIPALGKVNVGYFEVPDELAGADLGLMLKRQPTEEEWLTFYTLVENAFAMDKIGVSDLVFLMEIDNLKQARQMMAIRETQYKRQLKEDAAFNNQLAMDANSRATQDKFQGEMMKEKSKLDGSAYLEMLKGKISENIMRQEKEYEAMIAGMDGEVKERMKRQEGIDGIIKEAMRSRAERYKSDSSLQATIISAEQKAESDRAKAVQAKSKPKSKAK